jgi:hypothetical protein
MLASEQSQFHHWGILRTSGSANEPASSPDMDARTALTLAHEFKPVLRVISPRAEANQARSGISLGSALFSQSPHRILPSILWRALSGPSSSNPPPAVSQAASYHNMDARTALTLAHEFKPVLRVISPRAEGTEYSPQYSGAPYPVRPPPTHLHRPVVFAIHTSPCQRVSAAVSQAASYHNMDARTALTLAHEFKPVLREFSELRGARMNPLPLRICRQLQ